LKKELKSVSSILLAKTTSVKELETELQNTNQKLTDLEAESEAKQKKFGAKEKELEKQINEVRETVNKSNIKYLMVNKEKDLLEKEIQSLKNQTEESAKQFESQLNEKKPDQEAENKLKFVSSVID
jgi:chromosome segregation ATPase